MLKKTYSRFNTVLFLLLSLYLIFLLLRYPVVSLQYASTGLELWLTKMVPTLLPFMILSGIMIRMNLTSQFIGMLHPLLHRLFGTSKEGSYTVFMGFLCGFPMGARIVGELYEKDAIDRSEAACLLSFCNNIGPIYFLSYVRKELSLGEGLWECLIMYGIPLLYGIILCRFRKYPKSVRTPSKKPTGSNVPLLKAMDDSIVSGLFAMAKLGGYMIFFNLLNILFEPFTHVPQSLLAFYNCLLEITSGIHRCGIDHRFLVLILLPFGGFSCIAQTYSMINGTDLSLSRYVFHKLLQTALTACVYAVCVLCGVL